MPSSDLSSGYMSSDRIFRVSFRGKCIIYFCFTDEETKAKKE